MGGYDYQMDILDASNDELRSRIIECTRIIWERGKNRMEGLDLVEKIEFCDALLCALDPKRTEDPRQ